MNNNVIRTIPLDEDALHLDILGMKPGTPYLLYVRGGSRKLGPLDSGEFTFPYELCALGILKVILGQLFQKKEGRGVQVRGRVRIWLLFKGDVPEGDKDCWVYLLFAAKQEMKSGRCALTVSRFPYSPYEGNGPLTVPKGLKRHVANDSFIRFGIPRFL